jgi:ParB-like chromosome segregation protein Spo0J
MVFMLRLEVGSDCQQSAALEQSGQLLPITVSADGILLDGVRRVEAMKSLGREMIMAHVLKLEKGWTTAEIWQQLHEFNEPLK